MNQLKSIAKSIIDCTVKCEPQMPWMVAVTEDEFADVAMHKISDLLDIANRIAL